MSTNTPESPIEEGAASQNELSDQTKRKLKPGSPGKYRQVQLPSADMIAQEDFMNNCAVRTILSAGMGSLLGIAFGVFMGTMDTSTIDGSLTAATEKKSVRQVLREMAKSTASRSLSYAKGFGAMGALFAGSECVIEKMRAKHDMYNSIYAGCTTGAILAHSGGPKAMCIGCASFAAFSAAIDKFMGH